VDSAEILGDKNKVTAYDHMAHDIDEFPEKLKITPTYLFLNKYPVNTTGGAPIKDHSHIQ
jgi:hypothetical protein